MALEQQKDCVSWTGSHTATGYGQRRHNGKMAYVHRLAYEEVNGPIPEGMTIDHLCENKACYNVAHLELVTLWENQKRARRRSWKRLVGASHA